MAKEAITQSKCREKIIEALIRAEEDHIVYQKAEDFISYIGFPENNRNAKRMIQRALHDMNEVIVRKNGKNFEYINKAAVNDEPLSKFLSTEVKSYPELIIASHVDVYFLPVETKWTDHIIALIANTSLSLQIITMSSTYNGILIYVKSVQSKSFVTDFAKICKLTK